MSEGVLQAHMLTGGDTRGNPFVWFKVALAKINWFPSENYLNQSSQLGSKCQRNSSSRKSLFSWWESRKPLKLVEKLACQLSLTSRLGKTEGARYTLPQQRSDGSVTLEQTQDTATSMWIGLKKPITNLENFFQIHWMIARRWGNQYRFWSQGETISLTPIIRGQIGRFAHNCHVKSWLYSTADKANCRPEDWAVNLTSAWRLSLWQGV